MKISLIIPVYNEAGAIDQCLANLAALEGEVEILFADGGSTDGTLEKIGGCYRVLHCPKGRARQMNQAAQAADGDVLWFSHCDSLLPRDGLRQITAAVERGTQFGCFHIAFDYPGFLMACNAYNSNLRAKLWHIAFGDQGMFVTRTLFQKAGGFPGLPIMEDYEFSRRMKKAGLPLRVLPGRIVTSGRRYRTNHPLLTMWHMFYLRCLYRAGVDAGEIARRYRDVR